LEEPFDSSIATRQFKAHSMSGVPHQPKNVTERSVHRPFRIGIVGCGRISNAHIQAVLACPDAELAALVDPVVARANALAARYGVSAQVFAAVDDAVGHLDGAIIATPNHLHAEPAERCLAAGVPVLIEKPLAASLADGLRIRDAAAASDATAAVGYVTRFSPANQFMRDLLRRDAFGRVRRFAYQFGTRGGWAPLSAYNLDRATAGGGVLVVTGTHFLDRMLDWFGYPVHAGLRDDSHDGPEANAVASFEFEHPAGPIEGSARFSKTVALEGGIVLETDAGLVVLRDKPDAQVVITSERETVETVLRPRGGGSGSPRPSEFVLQLQDFMTAVRTGVMPMVSAESGLASLRLLDELYRCRRPMVDDWYAPAAAMEVRS
jgi:predicted dehydrogenase